MRRLKELNSQNISFMRIVWHFINNKKTAAWNSLETVPQPNRGEFHCDQWEKSWEITWYFGGFFPEEVRGDGGEVILAQEEGAEGWPEGQVVAVAQLCNLVTGQDKNKFSQAVTSENKEKLRAYIICRLFSGIHSIVSEKSAQPGEGGGARPHPYTILPSRTKLQCTLQLRRQIHFPYFYSTPICTLWFESQKKTRGFCYITVDFAMVASTDL